VHLDDARETLLIMALKMEGMEEDIPVYYRSSSSMKLKDITNFTYGANSARFWMLRKQINSISWLNFKCGKVPFYAWQCISISSKDRDVDLVIEKEKDMINLLTMLIYKLETVDGFRGSALPHVRGFGFQNTIDVYKKVLMRYKIMKVRMKISCCAFEQNKSILELFLVTILKTH
jgi:hypothetical protein